MLLARRNTHAPTGALLTHVSSILLQVQAAGILGRVPSVVSILLPATRAEMLAVDSFLGYELDHSVNVSLTGLVRGVAASASLPPALVAYVSERREEMLLPYWPMHRLSREIFKPGEELSASAQNAHACRFRTVLNDFRARCYPDAEPVFVVLDGVHKPYQTQVSSARSRMRCCSV